MRRYVGIETFVSVLTGLFHHSVHKPLGFGSSKTWAWLAIAPTFIPSIGSILGAIFPSIAALHPNFRYLDSVEADGGGWRRSDISAFLRAGQTSD